MGKVKDFKDDAGDQLEKFDLIDQGSASKLTEATEAVGKSLQKVAEALKSVSDSFRAPIQSISRNKIHFRNK